MDALAEQFEMRGAYPMKNKFHHHPKFSGVNCISNVIEGYLDSKWDYEVTKVTAKELCPCGKELGFDRTLVCVEITDNKWVIYHKECWK